MNERRTDVLVVDDNPSDAELVVASIRDRLPLVSTLVVRDGAQAMATLADRPASEVPRLILLDLKMPKVDGFEVLQQIKSDPRTRSIPVVVMTSSSLAQDVRLAYSLGANSYVVKPITFEELRETVGRVGEYWLSIDQGPHTLEARLTSGQPRGRVTSM